MASAVSVVASEWAAGISAWGFLTRLLDKIVPHFLLSFGRSPSKAATGDF